MHKIENVKPIFNDRIDNGLIFQNPFRKFKLIFKGDEAEALNTYQGNRQFDLEFKNDHVFGNPKLNKEYNRQVQFKR
jgi:hypothetical protein